MLLNYIEYLYLRAVVFSAVHTHYERNNNQQFRSSIFNFTSAYHLVYTLQAIFVLSTDPHGSVLICGSR